MTAWWGNDTSAKQKTAFIIIMGCINKCRNFWIKDTLCCCFRLFVRINISFGLILRSTNMNTQWNDFSIWMNKKIGYSTVFIYICIWCIYIYYNLFRYQFGIELTSIHLLRIVPKEKSNQHLTNTQQPFLTQELRFRWCHGKTNSYELWCWSDLSHVIYLLKM